MSAKDYNTLLWFLFFLVIIIAACLWDMVKSNKQGKKKETKEQFRDRWWP